MSVAVVMVAAIANRIEISSECRFDKTSDISEVNDEIDLETAKGLAAIAREDDSALQEALRNIDTLVIEFDHLIKTRDEIVEECQ